MLLMASLPLKFLLRIHLTPLNAPRTSIDMCLPSWSSDVLDAAWSGVIEDLFDLFKRFLAGFRKEEQNVKEHCNTKDTEDNVDFPSDIGERRWHEVGQSEVECPERS